MANRSSVWWRGALNVILRTRSAVAIPEEPGSFRQLIKHLERQNVTEFSYRYRDPRRAVVLVSFQACRGPRILPSVGLFMSCCVSDSI